MVAKFGGAIFFGGHHAFGTGYHSFFGMRLKFPRRRIFGNITLLEENAQTRKITLVSNFWGVHFGEGVTLIEDGARNSRTHSRPSDVCSIDTLLRCAPLTYSSSSYIFPSDGNRSSDPRRCSSADIPPNMRASNAALQIPPSDVHKKHAIGTDALDSPTQAFCLLLLNLLKITFSKI